MRGNSVLAKHHRVGIAEWTTRVVDERTRSVETLFAYLKRYYDGVEMDVDKSVALTTLFPDDAPKTSVVRQSRRAAEREGLQVFGSTFLVTHEEMRQLNWERLLKDRIRLNQDLGGQYASFQLFLHPDYMGTGGSYRRDEFYLRECADKVNTIREMTWDLGLNFYVETHTDRISEDPQAFKRIQEMATSEVTGDLSHYLYRGITKGDDIDMIVSRMGHTHVRMCRVHGDLSVHVDDMKSDWHAWDEKKNEYCGVTWRMFQLMKRGLKGGLSSRAIIGESGGMHLVTDSLSTDVALVPLYRALANYADMQVQGIELKVESPEDLNPWG